LNIHLVDLTPNPPALAAAERLLDAGELARADRFAFPHLRETFVLAHGVLRVLLARYAGLAPRALALEAGTHGKPRLVNGAVEFNLSHSGKLAAYAFSDAAVGIDVEEVRPLADLRQLARRSFCAGECADLATVAGDDVVDAFYACWSRKEAFIKAVGSGLSFGLDRFRVSLLPGAEPAVLHVEGDDAGRWQLHALDAGAGYAGAVAYRGPRRDLLISRSTAAGVLLNN
jgi:4'-phosphopantetheinyl transferase